MDAVCVLQDAQRRECTTVLDRASIAARRKMRRENRKIKKTFDCGNNQRFVNKISGVVLLSHSQICSTIAAGALNYRVREGNVCFFSAIDTRKNFQYFEFKKGS